jgi:hypothetical protein
VLTCSLASCSSEPDVEGGTSPGGDAGLDANADAATDAGAGGGASDGGGGAGGSLPEICSETENLTRGWQSAVVSYGADGHLVYQEDAERNRIPDFSFAGYRNGEVPLPQVATVKEIEPIDGDDTAHVQAAIDEVGAMPLDAAGLRGALLLRAGEYQIAGTLEVAARGVVLRGVGDGSDPAANTILRAVGNTPHQRTVLVVGSGTSSRWRDEVDGSRTDITSDFVAVGARTFDVVDASHLAIGDNVIVVHPCTSAWLTAVDHGGTAADAPWTVDSQPLYFSRYVTGLSGNTVTVDVPLYNHLDRSLAQSYLFVADRSSIVTNLGVESLRVDIETAGGSDENHAWNALAFVGVEDAWAVNTTTLHFGLSGVIVQTGSRITVANSRALDPVAQVTGSRMYNFNASPGQQLLFTGCEATNGRHHFVSNGTSWVSGVVFHECTSRGAYTSSEGHRRWSMAMLFDNVVETDVRSNGLRLIGLYNRGDWGTGHGWALAHSVAWSYDVGSGLGIVQKPPTAQNYAIGGAGEFTGSAPPAPYDQPEGHIEGVGTPNLVPASLYRAQLRDRLCP